MNEFKNESRDTGNVHGAMGHRRNGKIARLPRAVREQINELLDDGVEYDEIIKELGEAGRGLSKSNISRWVQGGYRDWVKEPERKALLEGNFSRVVDLLAKAEPDEVPDLIVKLMAARVGGVLSSITPQDLHENSEKDPRNLVRLLSLVPKLSREALRTRQFRRSVKREEAAEAVQRDPKREFGDEKDTRAVVNIVDKVLGLGRYTPQWIQDLPMSGEIRTESSLQAVDSGDPANGELHTGKDEAAPSSLPETTPPKAEPEAPTVPKWIPVDERPWNWQELNEYGYMSRFPPEGWVDPGLQQEKTNSEG